MGQHYPTDILASAVTGIGSAWLSQWLGKKIFPQKKTVHP
jgi:membrane-associated phospholipid phosphatase